MIEAPNRTGPGRGGSSRRCAVVLAVSVALLVVTGVAHADWDRVSHPHDRGCAICAVAHAPGLPANAPVILAILPIPSDDLPIRPVLVSPADHLLGSITLRSPPRSA